MKSFEPPQFLSNVYRDLRDRHLLIPAVALIIGLIAVPMLLKSSAEPVVAPPPVTSGNDAAATVPAVLAAEDVTVRDYQQRLTDLKSKNPFKQQFQPKVTDDAAAGTVDDPNAGLSGAPPGGTGATLPADPAGGVGGLNNTDTTNAPSPGDVDVVTHLFTRRVDVQVGVQGDLKNRNGVRPMTILPKNSNPVLAYLGTDESGKRAAFVVSSDATVLPGGTGACVPTLAQCLYITLEKDESMTFNYAPDGQTYELVLKRIKKVEL